MSVASVSSRIDQSIPLVNKEMKKNHLALESCRKALEIIFNVGVVLAVASIIGIWAVPLDVIVYSAGVKVMAIPITLVVLPLFLLILKIVQIAFKNKEKELLESFRKSLLEYLVTNEQPLDSVKNAYKQLSTNIQVLNLNISGCKVISDTFFTFLLESSKNIHTVICDISTLPANCFELLSQYVPKIKNLSLYQCKSLTEVQFQSLSTMNLSKIELYDVPDIAKDVLTPLILKDYRIEKTEDRYTIQSLESRLISNYKNHHRDDDLSYHDYGSYSGGGSNNISFAVQLR